MKGTKRYISGAWRLQAWDAATQRRVTKTVRAADTKAGAKTADSALRRMVDDIEAGRHAIDVSVNELLERWLRVKASTWEAKTLETNTSGARHLAGQLGHMKLDHLRAIHIEDCYVELAKTLAPATVRRIHGILHAALEQAGRWDLIQNNPASRVTPPKVERRTNTTPSPDQLLRLLQAVDDRADFAAYARLASSTGGRRGSVSALRWSDVDLDKGTVTFANKFSISKQGITEHVGSKTGRLYQVTIGLDINAALRRWRLEQKERALQLGVSLPPDAWVFTSPLDPRQPRRPDHWSREWRRLTRTVDPAGGLDHIRLHDLKHYAATQLLAGGMPVLMVAERLGMSPNLLLSLYGHAIPAGDRQAAELMDRLMKPGI